jgi:hypothetical protein
LNALSVTLNALLRLDLIRDKPRQLDTADLELAQRMGKAFLERFFSATPWYGSSDRGRRSDEAIILWRSSRC